MRPSKLRLPESTAAATMSWSLMVLEISGAKGPELPIQVVQPKPMRLYPSLSRSFCSPDLSRYSATTCEPGASEVLTQSLTDNPFATALRANRPAPTITFGLDVLVQDVIAAMTTSPWPRSCLRPATGTRFDPPALEKFLSREVASDGCRSKISLPPSPPLLYSLSIAVAKPAFTSLSATRSCGRLGPASDGSTCDSSSLSTSVKTGSGVDLVRYRPCALA